MIARLFRRSLATTAPGATILIRLIVGGVFLAEGIQKFLYLSEQASYLRTLC
jgi:putative oxidoreductase